MTVKARACLISFSNNGIFALKLSKNCASSFSKNTLVKILSNKSNSSSPRISPKISAQNKILQKEISFKNNILAFGRQSKLLIKDLGEGECSEKDEEITQSESILSQNERH